MLRRHWFILGLVAAAALAFTFPEVGARGGPLRPAVTTKAGVALIFLVQGFAISTASLRAGALRWRLHAVAQLFIFALFPACVLALDALAGARLPADLRSGFLYLSIVPTTIASCVVFTATARGNVSGALFNSAFANVIGVVVTPLLAALLLGARGDAPPLLPMMMEIAGLVAAPLLAGQLLRRVLRDRPIDAARASVLSNVIILYIVFIAFAGSVGTGAFDEAGLVVTAGVVAGAAFIFALLTGAAAAAGSALGFDPADVRALVFVAPQKTLAAGAPMAQIIFEADPALGVILLPLIAYHTVQLLGGASLAAGLGRGRAVPAPV
jgi:solute carrier family 10 (sodium/bile acid cotransporter), member 7